MNKILLVEDSEEYQKLVCRALNEHNITCSASVEKAEEELARGPFDLILLDIGLPKKTGYDLLAELQTGRQPVKPTPIMCLTGMAGITDKVTAFSLGAEDYIVKPFDPIELRARVNAKLRKASQTSQNSVIHAGQLEIDTGSHRVMVERDGKRSDLQLTQTEFKLLHCLAKSVDRVYTRDQLLVAAWGEDACVSDRVVDVHLCSLRKKLGVYSSYIQAVTGVGYKFHSGQQAKKRA